MKKKNRKKSEFAHKIGHFMCFQFPFMDWRAILSKQNHSMRVYCKHKKEYMGRILYIYSQIKSTKNRFNAY